METENSRKLYERAIKVTPAGVSYAIRYFEPYPIYIKRASGCRVYDVDGNEYIDYWVGHGALIMGHNPPVTDKSFERHNRSWNTLRITT